MSRSYWCAHGHIHVRMLLQVVDEFGARDPVVALLATLDPARAASRTKGLSIRTHLCRHEDSSRGVLLLLQPRQPRQPDGKVLFPMAGAVLKQDVPASVEPSIDPPVTSMHTIQE